MAVAKRSGLYWQIMETNTNVSKYLTYPVLRLGCSAHTFGGMREHVLFQERALWVSRVLYSIELEEIVKLVCRSI